MPCFPSSRFPDFGRTAARTSVAVTLAVMQLLAGVAGAIEPPSGGTSTVDVANPVTGTAVPIAARPPVNPPAAAGSPTPGERLLLDVTRSVAAADSIAAMVQQRVDLFGVRIDGKGSYLQQGRGEARTTRFELQMQSRSDNISLLEINVDDYLWRERRLPNRTEVTRVNLRRVRQAWQKAERASGQRPAFDFSRTSIAFGGLPKLLTKLEKNFRFGAVRETTIPSGSSQLPVYQVVGRWRAEKLAQMLPTQSEEILKGHPADLSHLPDHIPHEVLLVVDRDTLFPYVFEYRRYDSTDQRSLGDRLTDNANPGNAGVPFQRVAWLRLHDVQINRPVNTQKFIFNPGPDTEVRDITEEYLPPRDTAKLDSASAK